MQLNAQKGERQNLPGACFKCQAAILIGENQFEVNVLQNPVPFSCMNKDWNIDEVTIKIGFSRRPEWDVKRDVLMHDHTIQTQRWWTEAVKQNCDTVWLSHNERFHIFPFQIIWLSMLVDFFMSIHLNLSWLFIVIKNILVWCYMVICGVELARKLSNPWTKKQ